MLASALAAALLAASGSVAHAEAPASCTKFASPTGSDSANGTAAAPYRTVQALANALQAGQVGCLRAGTYSGGLRFGHGGSAGAPLVVRGYPGESAAITGRVYVPSGSDYVTVADVELNSAVQGVGGLPSPTIDANYATFEGDDVTNEHTGICFALGSEGWGVANSTTIAGDHIHDCGIMPAANHDHGIYVDDAVNTHIVGNLIDRNADRGIQLYPDSIGAVITNNVISENGEGIIFSGEGGVSSNGNVVEHNLIVNSLIRSDVESWYPAGTPIGVGNVVRGNCVSSRGINASAGGFTASANVTAKASELVATGEGSYQPAASSSCASVLAGSSVGTEVSGSEGTTPPSTPVGKESGGSTPPSSTPEQPTSTAPTTPAEAPTTGTPPTTGTGSSKTPTGTPTAPRSGKHRTFNRYSLRMARLRAARHRGHNTLTRSKVKRAIIARNRHHRAS